MLLAGVVHEDVDSAQLRDHLAHQFAREIRIADIARNGDCTAPLGFDQANGFLRILMLIQIGDSDIGALLGETDGNSAANSRNPRR